MRCSTCGAPVSALDVACLTCGADPTHRAILPIPPEPEGIRKDAEEPALVVAPEATTTPPAEPAPIDRAAAERQGRRATKIVGAAVLVLALSSTGALAVSRSSLAGRLDTADTGLQTARHQLADARTQIDALNQRVGELTDQADAARSRLDDVNAEVKDVRRSLTSCQDFIRIATELAKGSASQKDLARLTFLLVSCYEGDPPPSLFP